MNTGPISRRVIDRLKALREERGQILPILAVLMIGLLGMCAFTIDVGDCYYSFRQLQASTDAAALAGAWDLPNSTAAATATSYSGVAGGKNGYSHLGNFTMVAGYPKIECLDTLTKQGEACVAPANGNAIQVKQQVSVPMYFAALFGTKTVSMTATSTASMSGSTTTPYNVAIVIDATGSMSTEDTGECNNTRLYCALQGVRTLLSDLSPCASSSSTCTTTNGVASNPVDTVSLFTFPNMTSTTASTEYDCSSSSPTIDPYTFPDPASTSLQTMPYTTTTGTGANQKTTTVQMTYQITPYLSDYRASDTTSSLNNSSNITLAVGGKSGCTGMTNPGGEGTYYAGVLYQAQASLLAAQAASPGSQNVLILLSDGDATASQTQMSTGSTSTRVATSNGLYPSWSNECQQAVTAAQALAAAGTKVYAVAYGAASTGGCATDTGTYKGNPCSAMEAIASNPAFFFSDYTAAQNSGQCVSASQPTTNLTQIFTQIAGSLTVARLIPDGTT